MIVGMKKRIPEFIKNLNILKPFGINKLDDLAIINKKDVKKEAKTYKLHRNIDKFRLREYNVFCVVHT